MATQIRKREFPHTAAALVIFDAGTAARAAAWRNIESNEDADAVERQETLALQAVQDAFRQDTHDINSLENCRLVDIGFMRRMAQPALEVSNA